MGRAAIASGPHDAIRNGLDDGTGKEAKGFLSMVLPDLGGREARGSKRLQGRAKRRSSYPYIVGFHPPPVTSWVVQRTEVMPLTMDQPKVGMNIGQQ